MVEIVITEEDRERDRDKNSTWVARDSENLAPYKAAQSFYDEIANESKKFLKNRDDKEDQDTDPDNKKYEHNSDDSFSV
jgi:hypothetical protein